MWAQEKMQELLAKGRENWDEDDWDAFNYIENANAEADYYDRLED